MPQTASFKVYYEDTDCLGVVYYANYFRFMERGRTEYLIANDVDIAKINDDGHLLVVHSVQATYKKPARLGDTIDIESSFTVPSKYRGVFAQRLTCRGELLVDGVVDLVCVAPDLRLLPLPPAIAALGE